jgi:hypothetical protein
VLFVKQTPGSLPGASVRLRYIDMKTDGYGKATARPAHEPTLFEQLAEGIDPSPDGSAGIGLREPSAEAFRADSP